MAPQATKEDENQDTTSGQARLRLPFATRAAKRLLYMAAAHAGDQELYRRAGLKQSLQMPLSRRGHQ